MKAAYDDPNFVRKIYKYKGCRSNLTVFKRVLLPDWSVYGKITVKIRKIGKRNTQKKKGYTEDETEKDFLDSKLTKDKTIVMDYDEMNEAVASLPPLPTIENIMKILNNDKEPDENNENIMKILNNDKEQ